MKIILTHCRCLPVWRWEWRPCWRCPPPRPAYRTPCPPWPTPRPSTSGPGSVWSLSSRLSWSTPWLTMLRGDNEKTKGPVTEKSPKENIGKRILTFRNCLDLFWLWKKSGMIYTYYIYQLTSLVLVLIFIGIVLPQNVMLYCTVHLWVSCLNVWCISIQVIGNFIFLYFSMRISIFL